MPIEHDVVRRARIDGVDAPRPTFYQAYGKRALDLILGAVLLALAAPVILVLAGLVALSCGGRPFYSSERVGRSGRHFRLWKLRTMVADADELLQQWRASDPGFDHEFRSCFKLADDPRITHLGRFLRCTSLDELPQLWSVLRGDMSLVGPRPVVVEELSHYGPDVDLLLSTRPGLTGQWQVHGRGAVNYPERAWMELRGCASSSFLDDCALLAQTLLVPFRLTGR